MSKSGSTFTYNDPFKKSGPDKSKSETTIRSDLDIGSGSFLSSDPNNQQLFVSSLTAATLEALRLFEGVSDIRSLATIHLEKNFEEYNSATDFFVSDIGKFIYEDVVAEEKLAFGISKTLSDSVKVKDLVGIPDGLTYSFLSPEEDSTGALDVFERVVNYNRTFTDEFVFENDVPLAQPFGLFQLFNEPVEESSRARSFDILTLDSNLLKSDSVIASQFIALDTYKPLTDSTNADQFISLNTAKPVLDSTLSSDDDTIQFGKNLFNEINPSDDALILEVDKDVSDKVYSPDNIALDNSLFKTDSYVSTDRISLAFTTSLFDDYEASDDSVITAGKGLKDVVPTSDDQSFFINKFLKDSVITEDLVSIPDGITYLASKSIFETISSTDYFTRVFVAYRKIEDIVDSINDGQVLHTTKGLAHNTVLLDDQSFDVNKLLKDSAIASQQISFSVDKPLEDSAITNQKIFLSPSLSKSDEVNNISDISNIDYIKVQRDSQGISDSSTTSFEKLLKDTVLAIDLSSLYDGSTYTLNNRELDSAGTSDNLTRVVDYNRLLSHSIDATERLDISADLSKKDSVSADQRISLDFSTSRFDNSTADDLIALSPELFKEDAVSNISDDETFNITLGKYENISTSQFLAFTLAKELADSFNVGQFVSLAVSLGTVEDVIDSVSDADTIQFTKAEYDTVGNSDNQVFDITKLIKDSVDTEDLVSVPDGITYIASKTRIDFATASDVISMLLSTIRAFEEFNQVIDSSTLSVGKTHLEPLTAEEIHSLVVDKPIKEHITANQFVSLDFSTAFDETLQSVDSSKLDTVLHKKDLITTSDRFVISFNVLRTFRDTVLGNDKISFESESVKRSNANADEKIILSPTKVLNDTLSDILDAPYLAPNLGKSDIQIVSDSISVIEIGKFFRDEATIDDLLSVPDGATYYATKRFKDTTSSSDIFSRVVDYNRTFTDTIEFGSGEPVVQPQPFMMRSFRSFATFATYNEPTGDSSESTDKIAFDTNKALADEFSTPDDDVLHIGKNILDDGVTQSVFVVTDFSKALSHKVENLSDSIALTVDLLQKDTTSTSDDLYYKIIFRRTLKDSVVSSQFISLDVDLVKEDSAAAEQFVSLDTIKQFAHETNETTDLSVLKPALLKKHSATATESLSFGISKFFKDSAVIDDLLSVPDGATYYAHKQIKDSIGSPSDKLTRVVDYNRLFNSEYGASDDDVLSFGKFVESDFSTSQFVSLGVDLFKEDSTTGLTDSIAAEFSKVLPIDYAYPEDKTPLAVTLGKTSELNDVHDLIDLTLIYNRFFAHSVTQSDDQAFTVIKSLTDTQSTSDDQSFDISKLIKSAITLSDAISIDGSTYTLDKSIDSIINNISDDQSFDISKLIKDGVTLDDAISLDGSTYSLFKLVKETINTPDDQSFDISKLIKSSVTLDDAISIDGSTYTLDKSIDSIINNITDDQSFDISKLIKSAVTLDDAISLDGSTYTLNKSIANSINNITDDEAFVVGKNLAHIQNTSDDQSFDISKLIKSAVTLDDAISLDGSTYSLSKLINDDFASISDDQSFAVDKFLEDSINVGQFISLAHTKPLDDSVSNSDENVLTVEKLIKSGVTLDDAISLDGSTYTLNKSIANSINNISDNDTIDFTKFKNDTLTVSDDDQYLALTKFIESSITLSDAISIDGSTYSLTKVIDDDFASVNDDQSFTVVKLLESLTNADEFATLETNKKLTDSISNSDDDVLNVGKYLDDSVEHVSRTIFDSIKFLDDDAYPVQLISLGTEKPFAHSVDNIDDDDTLQFTKGINNNVSNSDDQTFDVSKLLKDSTIVDDLIGVPDGSTYYASKKLVSSTQASEKYSKVWNVVRKFEDISNVSEFVRIQSSINKEETLNTNDSETLNVGLFKSNAAVSIDASAFRFDKGDITDNVVSLEAARLEVTLGTIEDSVNNDDDSIELNSSLAKEDNAAATASGLLTVQNYTADAFYWAEDYVGESRTL
jgi:hypothetical protein